MKIGKFQNQSISLIKNKTTKLIGKFQNQSISLIKNQTTNKEVNPFKI